MIHLLNSMKSVNPSGFFRSRHVKFLASQLEGNSCRVKTTAESLFLLKLYISSKIVIENIKGMKTDHTLNGPTLRCFNHSETF